MVFSKSDIKKCADLDKNSKTLIQNFLNENPKIKTIELSTFMQDNIGKLKELACECFTE